MPSWISKLKRTGFGHPLRAVSAKGDPARGTTAPSSRLEARQATVILTPDTAATSVGSATESSLQSTKTTGENFWDRAWSSIQQGSKHTKLLNEYEKALLSAYGDTDVSIPSSAQPAQSGRQEQVARLVARTIEDVDKKKMTLSGGSRELVVREQVDRIIKALLFAQSAVTAAVSSQPFAAVAWSGVCLLVNLLSNSSTERTALTEGLDYITQVICRFSVVEDVYREQQEHDPTSVEQAKAVEFAEALVKVYSHILLYQMHVVAQLSRSKLSQLGRDVIKSNDWSELLASIQGAETEFNQRRQVLDSGRVNRGLSQQGQQMDKMLKGHSELVKITNETLEVIHEHERHSRTEDENRCHATFRVSDYVSDKDRNPRRVPGTCGWFMHHENYQKWRDNDKNDLLWVSADPGCGKSVLSRFLIEELFPAEDTFICYFFFKDEGKEQRSPSSAVCALLHQLYADRPALVKHALRAFNREGVKLQNLFSELWAILRASVTDPAAGNIICVLDALDECEESGRILLIDALKQFHRNLDWNGSNGYVKFLATSRPYQSIERKFRALENALPQIRLAGEDETESIKEEIDLVIKDRVGGLRDDLELDSKVAANLESKLLSMDHRTYLWLKLVLFELENNFSASTSKKLLAFIDVIPETVEEAYEGILNRSTDKQLARKVLNIVVAAQRPLTLSEMDVALAVGDNVKSEAELDLEGDKNLRINIRNLCGLFLNITDSKVYLMHQTAREFLMGNEDDPGGPSAEITPHMWKHSVSATKSNGILAKVCLEYLSLEEFDSHLAEIPQPRQIWRGWGYEWEIDEDIAGVYVKKHTFLPYSAKFWISHAQKAKVKDNSPFLQTMAHVCDTTSNRFRAWYFVENRSFHSSNSPNFSPASFATIHGLVPLLRLLLSQKGDVNAKDDHNWTALHFAAERRDAEVAGLLLESGAEVSVENNNLWTPLHIAAYFGHEEVMMQLIDKGADVSSGRQFAETPLHCASIRGQLSAVSLLLVHGAIIDATDSNEKTSLIHAAFCGHLEVVELLLGNGADIQAADNLGGTPLNYAAEHGYWEVVKLLLAKGADANAARTDGETPLFNAVLSVQVEAVKLLLEKGADANATKRGCGSTALSCAAEHYGFHSYTLVLKENLMLGLEAIMRTLLAHGPDPTIRDADGRTTLDLLPRKCTEMRGLLEAAEAEWTSSHSPQANLPSNTEKDQLEVVSEGRQPALAI
ncbi:Ankyrin-2 [Trapelia coarctata]|nr:Ankyrin-2 [Trapelia coarctata]